MSLVSDTNAGHNIEQLSKYMAMSKADLASFDLDYWSLKESIFHIRHSSADLEVSANASVIKDLIHCRENEMESALSPAEVDTALFHQYYLHTGSLRCMQVFCIHQHVFCSFIPLHLLFLFHFCVVQHLLQNK